MNPRDIDPEHRTVRRGFLTAADRATMRDDVRTILLAAPLVRPRTPGGAPMRVRVSAAGDLGWVGDGAYRYDRKQADGQPWPPIPRWWCDRASEVAGSHAWDSAIINWYDDGAALGWHRDLAEKDHTSPIVTFSLGDSASWAVRRFDGDPVERCVIDCGDATVLAGPMRLAWHSIERIIPSPITSCLATRGRLSITMRVAG